MNLGSGVTPRLSGTHGYLRGGGLVLVKTLDNLSSDLSVWHHDEAFYIPDVAMQLSELKMIFCKNVAFFKITISFLPSYNFYKSISLMVHFSDDTTKILVHNYIKLRPGFYIEFVI